MKTPLTIFSLLFLTACATPSNSSSLLAEQYVTEQRATDYGLVNGTSRTGIDMIDKAIVFRYRYDPATLSRTERDAIIADHDSFYKQLRHDYYLVCESPKAIALMKDGYDFSIEYFIKGFQKEAFPVTADLCDKLYRGRKPGVSSPITSG